MISWGKDYFIKPFFYAGRYVDTPRLCRNPPRSRTAEQTHRLPKAGMAATEAAQGVPRKGEERKRGGREGEKRARPPDPHRGVQDCGWGRARPPQKSLAAPLRLAGATAPPGRPTERRLEGASEKCPRPPGVIRPHFTGMFFLKPI